MDRNGILLFSLVSAACLALAGDWPSTMDVYRGSTPVLDGKIGKCEYRDATVFHGAAGWNDQFTKTPVLNTNDLSFTGWVKHDGTNLFFAFDITDDVLYGYETGWWVPDENPVHVHDFTKSSFPWFGDGVELLINANNIWPEADNTFNYGDARSWQVVCNQSKSLLGGIGQGGLIQGEQRDDPNAWSNYEKWIRSGAMQAVVKVKPDRRGYIVEWMITPACLQVDGNGSKWSPESGTIEMGLNIGIQDLDWRDTAPENWGRIHHEVWWAGEPDKRTWPKQWGTMVVHPEPKPCGRILAEGSYPASKEEK